MFSIIQAAGWPIWPLIASSILALAIVIERFSALVESKVAPKGLADTVIAVTQKGLPSKDSLADLEQNSMLGEVLASALHLLKTKPKAVTCADTQPKYDSMMMMEHSTSTLAPKRSRK